MKEEKTTPESATLTEVPTGAAAPTAAPEVEAEEPTTVVKFSKPITFEGKTYTEIDLAGLDTLTAEDMIAASNYLVRKGNLAPTQEMNIEYACFIAGRATGLPVEFFRALPMREATKLKNRVTNFFYSED